MEAYLLTKLVAAKPMRLAEWYAEVEQPFPEDEIDAQGFLVIEDRGQAEESMRWVTAEYFAQHYTKHVPH